MSDLKDEFEDLKFSNWVDLAAKHLNLEEFKKIVADAIHYKIGLYPWICDYCEEEKYDKPTMAVCSCCEKQIRT